MHDGSAGHTTNKGPGGWPYAAPPGPSTLARETGSLKSAGLLAAASTVTLPERGLSRELLDQPLRSQLRDVESARSGVFRSQEEADPAVNNLATTLVRHVKLSAGRNQITAHRCRDDD